jgi:5-methylcytosine-specific restriction endonuclease McrA
MELGKVCTGCGVWKLTIFFGRNKRSAGGIHAKCKVCRNTERREYYQEKGKQIPSYFRRSKPSKKVINARAKKYYIGHREKELERSRLKSGQRAAAKLASGGVITPQEWEALKKKYNHTCLKCKRREPDIKLTLDHVKPLRLGGENTISNAQPLCGSCNSSKGAKWIDYR